MAKFTNRLAKETSPYLLQHAHNPVDWYPWGAEALERSRTEDKPILLSIGYSACHWCHVMEHESFENEEIARQMNENFVNIKVDREERPDLDQIYMNAVQMITRQGGWPLTVFLTPDLVPFYGGTYFPPEDRHHMPGFPRVLAGVADAYRERPEEVKQSAWEILSELRRIGIGGDAGENLSTEILDNAFKSLSRSYDALDGGFGSAPKFPASMNLEFLLRYHARTGNPTALQMVTNTLRKMANGGMYDQLGGGFHRYSTDRKWLVPHFEKMLYDNALLSRVYLHAYQQTGDAFYRRVVEETLDYVAREMTDERGGFYSTQDADSEGVEGKFFVWSILDIMSLLGDEDGQLFCGYYGVSEEGNFEGENILNVARAPSLAAEEMNVKVERLNEAIERGRRVLFDVREKRIKPARDEKVITAWNGLMLESFAEAAAVLERPEYRAIAERNADFVLKELSKDGLLLHVFKDSGARHVGFLDDYSYFISGLITLFETSGAVRWLKEAIRLTDTMIKEFWDDDAGGFFYVGVSGERLIVRSKDYFDNATPSGNTVAARLLLRLQTLTGDERYRRLATSVLRIMREQIGRYPSAFGNALCALDFYFAAAREIVLISPRAQAKDRALLREVWKRFLPNKVVVQLDEGDAPADELALIVKGKTALEGRTTAYVCENYSCQQPVTTAEELAKQLE
jgi:uncharacterized protein YyaL (SSP411 family)